MDHSVSFARHFARLVWLLMREPENIDEQKAALGAAVLASGDGATTLSLEGSQVAANGVPLTDSLGAVGELAQRFVGHEVRELNALAGATEADLLHAARVLGAEPTFAPDAGTAAERLATTGAQTVWFLTGKPTANPQSEPTPVRGDDFAFAAPTAGPVTTGVVRGARAMLGHFVAKPTAASPEELLQRLDSAPAGAAATRALEDLITFVETAIRDGRPGPAADVLAGIVRRESATDDDAHKPLYATAVARLSTPQVLRAVAALLPGAREQADDYSAILLRLGDKGADAVIDQLTRAQGREGLRAFFDILLELRPDTSPLLHMLGDERWYVVRNAAELLGEMKAVEADRALAELLAHEDERVRGAAAGALAQLDTPAALKALQEAIADADSTAEVREEAASALANRRGERTSAITLARALDSEGEPQVQFAILAALGKVATPEAIDRLVEAAEPDGFLFRRKSIAFRVAAVRALSETRSPVARGALQALLSDRAPEVREAAAAFLAMADAPPAHPGRAPGPDGSSGGGSDD